MAWRDNGRGNLRELYESKGAATVEAILLESIRKGEAKPDDFSIQELWKAFTADAPLFDRAEMHAFVVDGRVLYGRDQREAVGTGSFEKITGALINAKVIEGYNAADVIWPNLVTSVPGKLKKETVAGMTAQVFPLEVTEGMDYEGSGIEEKYVTIQTKKYGRIVDVTEEMIFFDQTGQVLNRAKMLGEECNSLKEKLIVQGVQDVNTNAYNPSDTATALYSAANGNLKTSNAFNSGGLAAIEKLAHQMIKDGGETNYMNVNLYGKPALFPVDLMEEAWELSNSPTQPETAERAPNYWKGKYIPLTSPWVTGQSPTTWFWGDFKRCAWWMDIWPLETFDAKNSYKDFEADIKARHKVRFYGGFGFIDHKYVFKSTA